MSALGTNQSENGPATAPERRRQALNAQSASKSPDSRVQFGKFVFDLCCVAPIWTRNSPDLDAQPPGGPSGPKAPPSNLGTVPAANRYIVPTELDGMRLDKALRLLVDGLAKNDASMLIGRKRVRVNNRPVTFDSWEVRTGYIIEIAGTISTSANAHVFDLTWILADDGLLLAINKPSGLRPEERGVVDRDNLVTLLAEHFGQVVVPVHRIDRDTSGVMLLVRKSAPRQLRSELDYAFKEHEVKKRYLAVIARPNSIKAGRMVDLLGQDREHRDRMTVVDRNGDRAETIVEMGEANNKRQQLHLIPITGRTHQLRVQLAWRHAPILGDRLYGSKAVSQAASRLLLHAERLEIPPIGGHEARVFEAPIPRELTIIANPEPESAAVADAGPDGAPRTAKASRPNTPKPPRETKRAAGEKAARKR